jgi:hypothetical protein
MKKLTLFALLVMLIACGRDHADLPLFDLEAAMNGTLKASDSFTLNDIVEVVDIIPIETHPDKLIGSANLRHIGKNHFYIRHDNAVSRIDNQGNILTTISRQGRGPGEYLGLTMADFNESASTIRIFDQQGDKYVTYNMGGEMIDEGSLSKKGVELPRFFGSDYMLMRGARRGNHRLWITDRDMNILHGLFPMDTTLTESDRLALTMQVGVGSAGGDEALVGIITGDTLYRVNKREVTPEAILHKGQYRRSEEPIFQITTPDSPHYFISTQVDAAGDYYFMRHITTKMLALEIWDKSGGLIAHIDSREGFRFAFPSGGETRVSWLHVSGDTVAFVVDAIDAAGSVEGVQEDDNPVIVVAKLKK